MASPNNDNIGKTENVYQRNFIAVANTKNRTAEMTWGETSNTQAKTKGETLNKNSCFALTSVDLFAVSLYFDSQREQHASFNLFERCTADFA